MKHSRHFLVPFIIKEINFFFLHILTRYKKRFLEEEKHIKKTMHWGYIYGQDMKTLKLIELSGFVYEKKLFSEEKWL